MSQKDHYLYCVSVACPNCLEVTQFVEVTDEPVALDMDVPLRKKNHCPFCAANVDKNGGWDRQAEHEIEAIEPSNE